MSDYWSELSRASIDVDRTIAGLHGVELLESMSPYGQQDEQYFPRITRALEALPRAHWDAAMAVFASVIFLPKPILDATWGFLWWAIRRRADERGTPLSVHAEDVHIMEVDADGLVPDFARYNGLSARLNAAVHPRIPDVGRLRHALSDASLDIAVLSDHAVAELRLAAEKTGWILLTDKALSGQSLLGDLQRVAFARDVLTAHSDRRPTIYVGAQVLTEMAEQQVRKWMDASGQSDIELIPALRLDNRASVGSPECKLFADDSTRLAVIALCAWFDENVVALDRSLDTLRARSGGSFALGYKGTGITLVDSLNTPTNSLPILWFNSEDPGSDFVGVEKRPTYVAPFPRVHSRRGMEDPRWSEGALWEQVMTPAVRVTIEERVRVG